MVLLNIKEVADILRVSKNTVSSPFWRERHGLKSFHIGNRVLFSEEEVRRFIAEKQAKERYPQPQ